MELIELLKVSAHLHNIVQIHIIYITRDIGIILCILVLATTRATRAMIVAEPSKPSTTAACGFRR